MGRLCRFDSSPVAIVATQSLNIAKSDKSRTWLKISLQTHVKSEKNSIQFEILC
jgi:hypothetical protein